MRYLILLMLLMGCNTVKGDLSGQSVVKAEALGYSFNVFPNDSDFQVVRTNFGLPKRATYLQAVALAVRQATGCDIIGGSLTGDFNLTKGKMRCP